MQVSDADHIDRLISCLYMALPFVVVRTIHMILLFSLNGSFYVFLTELCLKLTTQRGASSSKFLNYLNKHIIPVFDKVILHFPCLEIVGM
jgi:hypothetical protein